jgi:hypothetical protein
MSLVLFVLVFHSIGSQPWEETLDSVEEGRTDDGERVTPSGLRPPAPPAGEEDRTVECRRCIGGGYRAGVTASSMSQALMG